MLFSKNARVCNNGKYKKYSGYLKCADCGCSMYREKSPKVNYPYYYCGNYRNKKGYTKHYINELELDRLILEVLNKEIDLFCNVEADIEKVILNSRIEYQADLENIRKEKIANEIKKYELLLKEYLNDYKNGLLSEEDFDTFNDDYLFNLNKLRIEQEEICNNDKLDLEWFNKFKKYKKVESITRDILDSLIEKILIYEDGNIKIIFNFQNEYDELIGYLNSHDFVV